MARYKFQGTFRDKFGHVVGDGTISAYLVGTTTPASIYAASSGGTAVNSVTSSSNGYFYFYVDQIDYTDTQRFKVALSKSGFLTSTYDDIIIFHVGH
jgi:hypothetical protein